MHLQLQLPSQHIVYKLLERGRDQFWPRAGECRVEAGDGVAACCELFSVDDGALAAGGAKGDDTAQGREAGEVLGELCAANHVEEKINAFAISCL